MDFVDRVEVDNAEQVAIHGDLVAVTVPQAPNPESGALEGSVLLYSVAGGAFAFVADLRPDQLPSSMGGTFGNADVKLSAGVLAFAGVTQQAGEAYSAIFVYQVNHTTHEASYNRAVTAAVPYVDLALGRGLDVVGDDLVSFAYDTFAAPYACFTAATDADLVRKNGAAFAYDLSVPTLAQVDNDFETSRFRYTGKVAGRISGADESRMLGAAVAVQGRVVVVGAPGETASGKANAGVAYTFRLSETTGQLEFVDRVTEPVRVFSSGTGIVVG